MNYEFFSKDCPKPDGPELKPGDCRHTMTVPLDDGGKLRLHIGEKGRQALLQMLGMQKADDERDFQIMCGRLVRRLPEDDPLHALACDLIRRKGTGTILREAISSFRPSKLNTEAGLRDAAECIIGHVPDRLADLQDGGTLDDWVQVDEKLWVAAVMIAGRWLHDGPDRT